MFRREQRAVSGNAACCASQRSVLCGATRRAVSGNAACCVGQRTVPCWTDVYVLSVLLWGFAHDGWGEEEGLAVSFLVAMGTDGDNIVLDGHLAGDGDEGTTGIFAEEDGIADGAALGAVEGVAGVALPIAEGAGDEGSVRGWLLTSYCRFMVGCYLLAHHKLRL